MIQRHLALALVLAPAHLASAQVAAPQQAAPRSGFAFTIDNIMRGPEVYGREPQRPRFSADGRWIYFRWLPPGTDWREQLRPYRVRAAAGATPEVLSEAAWDSAAPSFERGARSPDGCFEAVAAQGDIWVVDQRTAAVRRLTETVATESEPSFSGDGRRVYFTRDNNVYAVELDGGLTRQLTDIRTGPAPKPDSTPAGQRGALQAQQRILLEAIRDRLRADSIAKAQREAREKLRPKTLYLKERERIARLLPSPNGRALLIVTETPASTAQQTRV
ncbi:MAG TPA: DPP IV N-terminal domain-containing protein, partial [Gemmatimonadaceae bacterium]|nr:DPP IV N-terminal domain-containing protein [Gemmatimonadaceae bacterium]